MPTAPVYARLGPVALASRLRSLADRLAVDSAQLYERYGVAIRPHWFPVFYALSQNPDCTATELATEVGQSHVAVGKTLGELARQGLVRRRRDRGDARRVLVSLTEAGRDACERLGPQLTDVGAAVERVLAEAAPDLWDALDRVERALDEAPLLARARSERHARESAHVEIVDYRSEHRAAFRDLNLAWIERHFAVEPEDVRLLSDPEGTILAPGGYIAVALWRGEAVGVCGLLPMPDDPDYEFELVKMAVAPEAQGLGLGERLGRRVLAEAARRGARRVYLESNPVLTPALALYRKLGFRDVPPRPGHAFARAGTYMGYDVAPASG